MSGVVICTSVEHDWGGHIGCNFDRMIVGEIWSESAEARAMNFEDLLDQACKSAHLLEMARVQLPSALSDKTKHLMLQLSPDELGRILNEAIDAVNHGSVKSIDVLVNEHLNSR